MKKEWLGKGYRKQFELLDITQEGLDLLKQIHTHLVNSDKEAQGMYAIIYKEKYKKGKKAIDWNIRQLTQYFRKYKNNPENFMSYISQLTRISKRQIFYLVKDIFSKK